MLLNEPEGQSFGVLLPTIQINGKHNEQKTTRL